MHIWTYGSYDGKMEKRKIKKLKVFIQIVLLKEHNKKTNQSSDNN